MPSRGTYAKGSARREEILATALRVIAEKGYHRATLRGIGRELGIEPAHILYYFESREDLLREVVERWDAGSLADAGSGADSIEVFVSAIRHNLEIRGIVHLYLSFATEAIEAGHPAHEFFRSRFARATEELAATLRAGQQEGLVRAEIDAVRSARLIIAMADGLQLQSLIDPAIDAPSDLEAAIDDLFVARHRVAIDRPSQLDPRGGS